MSRLLIAALLSCATIPAWAQDTCPHRGDLDAIYCDADRNLTADPPRDPAKLRNPASLLLSYSPQEDTAAYEKMWAPFVEHMAQCVGRKIRFFQVFSSAAVVEALRSGRIQFSLLATGDTPFAVNVAGAVPYAGIGGGNAQGKSGDLLSYHVVVLVKQDSPFMKLADLKGKRVAHTAASSNSGNMAPRALFPAQGLTPDKDYKVIYSGKHDNSITGVLRGDYDAAAVADDVLDRMLTRGLVKPGDYRIIYKSKPFPAGSMVLAHDLDPALTGKLRSCTFSYAFSPELKAAFQGADRYVPMDYRRDFESVRAVANAAASAGANAGSIKNGESIDRAGSGRKQRETGK
ncbi:MAG: phosphate/phosphite/phosphonate ABC transporter substrate-binding protein [Betaproteobacteria bacterium]